MLHKCQKLQPEIVVTFILWYKLINNTFRHDLMFLNLKLTVLCFGHYTVPNAALSQNYIGTDDIDIIVQES